MCKSSGLINSRNLFNEVLSSTLNKFSELFRVQRTRTFIEKPRKKVLRVQRTRTFIGALTNVRVRWTQGNCFFAFSINVQVLWTC
jgi:hypothetical protein